jgi:hypothetical protein
VCSPQPDETGERIPSGLDTKMREPPDLPRIADLIHGAAIRVLNVVRREDSAAGLSAPQLSTLSVLVFKGSQPTG